MINCVLIMSIKPLFVVSAKCHKMSGLVANSEVSLEPKTAILSLSPLPSRYPCHYLGLGLGRDSYGDSSSHRQP